MPVIDWLFALTGCLCAAYLYIFSQSLATRAGGPVTMDLVTAGVGMLLLLEATRRALGPPLMIVAAVFIMHAFAGPYMPDVIAHKGASLNKALSHLWITSKGIFGVALGVSTSFVFLFVLFGSLLEKVGAGNYFIQVAFSLLDHLKGGPAKSRRGLFWPQWYGFRFFHCQRGNHQHLYHSTDEAGWIPGL